MGSRRYYFHIRVEGELILDNEGIELKTDELARKEAIRAAAELMREYPQSGKEIRPQSISVADETGRELFVVPINPR